MSETKTLKEVVLAKNPSVFNYVYNLGDDYLFIKSLKKNSAGNTVFDYRHFDINRLPPQEMTSEKFLNTFQKYSVKTYGMIGGRKSRGKKSRKYELGKKRKTQKRLE